MPKTAKIPGTEGIFSYRIPLCKKHVGEQLVKYWHEWICRSCVFDSLDPCGEPLPGRKQNVYEMTFGTLINRKARRAG